MTYVFVKLVSGEQLMATLKHEAETHLEISNPMIIRMMPIAQDGRIGEHVTATPFCHFADSRDFSIPKTSIMFVKGLSQTIVPHYLQVIDQYEDSTFKPNEKRKVEWGGEEEEMTLDEINKRIEMLESTFSGNADEEELDAEEKRVYVDGNDTLH